MSVCPEREEIIKVVFGHSSGERILLHLKECPRCIEVYNEYRVLWNDLSQLQHMPVPPSLYDYTKNISEKENVVNPYKSVIYYAIYLVIAIPLFIYFYYKENHIIQYNNIPISRLTEDSLIKKYYLHTYKILRDSYQKNWFPGTINKILSNYGANINKTYIQYFNPFIERLGDLDEYSKNDFIKSFKNIYEVAIFSYFFSQELKIKKVLYREFSLGSKRLLDNILSYLMFSQNRDGGFGILPRDQKSLQQTMFWVSLFIKNYTLLTNTIPHPIIEKIESYISNKTDVISAFVKSFLFNQLTSVSEEQAQFVYLEQILSHLFITNKSNTLFKEYFTIFL